jgi:hypothetical protein
VKVTCVNDNPVADNETLTVAAGNSAVGNTRLGVGTSPAQPSKSIARTGATDVLVGDTDVDGPGPLTVVSAGSNPAADNGLTADGGTVTIAANGDFTYTPAANDPGCTDTSDSFDYVVSDQYPGTPGTDIGTVTIQVADCVWYVDSSVAGPGTGTSSDPFKALSGVNGAGGAGDADGAGDTVMILDGSSYSGGLPLENNQVLRSKRAGLTVGGNTIVTAAGASNPTITNGSGNAVTLASGNTIQGIDLGSTPAGSAALFGNGVGTATVNTVASGSINNTSGGAVNISGGTLNMAFTSVSSANSAADAIRLDNTAGTFTASGGSLQNAGDQDVDLSGDHSGDNVNFTYDGTITDDVGQLVNVSGQSGGTKDFNGAITDGNDGDGNGVSLSNNTGATVRFDGGLTLSTGANAAFAASGGGIVAVTDPNAVGTAPDNTLTTGTGTALTIANTTISADDVNFRSISANGAVNGIVLNTTGASGGLDVTGNGGACAVVGDVCTGGTIASTSGDALSLSSTRDVDLTRMKLLNNLGNGVRGDNVTNFAVKDSVVDNNGDSAALDEAGLHFTNLAGTSEITRTAVANSPEDEARILNSSATLGQLDVTDSIFRDTDTADPGNNGLLLQADATGSITADVLGSKFLRNRANGLQVINNGSGTVNVDVNDSGATQSQFDDNNIGLNFADNGSGSLVYTIRNLDVNGINASPFSASPINLNLGGAATGTMSGTVQGNTLTNNNSPTGPGIRVISNGTGGTLTTLLDSNTISGVAAQGIQVMARDGSSRINATITNNTVTLPNDPLSLDAIRVDSGAVSTDNTTVCADISGNTASTPTVAAFGIRARNRFAGTHFILENYAGSATSDAQVISYLQGRNPATSSIGADHGTSPGFENTAGCPMP